MEGTAVALVRIFFDKNNVSRSLVIVESAVEYDGDMSADVSGTKVMKPRSSVFVCAVCSKPVGIDGYFYFFDGRLLCEVHHKKAWAEKQDLNRVPDS